MIALLAERWPDCFVIYERRRRPLKVGIRIDIVAALGDAVDYRALKLALRLYTSNRGYLRACTVGADRIDLDGNAVSQVTADEAANAAARLAGRKAKSPTPIAKSNNGATTTAVAAVRRLSLADLKAAAAARREKQTPATFGMTGA